MIDAPRTRAVSPKDGHSQHGVAEAERPALNVFIYRGNEGFTQIEFPIRFAGIVATFGKKPLVAMKCHAYGNRVVNAL